MSGREERCNLWKKDPKFPESAWVFEATEMNSVSYKSTIFTPNLKDAIAADGYQIEFIYLYGQDCMTPKSGWGGQHQALSDHVY